MMVGDSLDLMRLHIEALFTHDAASLCCSVRRSAVAHEAGVETAAPYRGGGLAGRAVSTWASSVRAMGRIPLYSTSWSNEASRAVARKLGLVQFGNDLHVI